MNKFQLLVSTAGLVVGSTAFVAPNNVSQRSSTHLDMAAALIVQNKGGGHGELGR